MKRWHVYSLVMLAFVAVSAIVMSDSLSSSGLSSKDLTPVTDPTSEPTTGVTASPTPTAIEELTGTPTAGSTETPVASPTAEPESTPTPEFTPTPTAVPAPVNLVPDLVTLQPNELQISIEEDRKLLRFSNHIGNMSGAVLELFPGPTNYLQCTELAVTGRAVFQRVYTETQGYGYFTRGNTDGYEDHMIGCMVFHEEHDHWHIDNFTSFDLVNESGRVVSGAKNSTCMMDSHRGFNIDGTVIEAHFLYEDCGTDSSQGISVGWIDTYEYFLPDMFIDVTGVPDGVYCLVSTADPDGQIVEQDRTNNTASIRLEIIGDTVQSFPDVPCESQTEVMAGPGMDPPSNEVFMDTLFWRNDSWDIDLNREATERVYENRWSMGVRFSDAYGGLSLHSRSGFNTTGYTHLSFMVHPHGKALPPVNIFVTTMDEAALSEVAIWQYAVNAEDGWYRVTIPLSELNARDIEVGGLVMQDQAGSPSDQFFVDELRFVSLQP